jgi:hypothetical protein
LDFADLWSEPRSLALEGEDAGALARASRQLARSAELPAHVPVPSKPPSRASGLALLMLAAGKPESVTGWMIIAREIALLANELGRVHRARGEHGRAQQIETELGAELARIEVTVKRERTPSGEHLDAEYQTAQRAREPLQPPSRAPGQQGAAKGEDPKRPIGPLKRRRRRGR